ncbi:hypothetical protein LCER1_G008611 [Lachnellula cervina]|uniref:Uncharacterized protein n=1 Tax=Lachnellula cervina TaxID=1316786 RepID=A0A7D8YXX4_9HELO|nr:hypothetical protein LCER1_G008611 [Lachnellula cervina]
MIIHRFSDLPLLFLELDSLPSLIVQTRVILSSMNMGGNNGGPRQSSSYPVTTVAEALEIARDSEDDTQDPTVRNLLETAIAEIWARIQAQPTSYVMNREEFAVFNYFQHRFEGLQVASSARKRYWDSLEATNGA